MEKKYIMTNETKTLEDGTILHRIKAVKDFGDVKKGYLGGWIEKEENLSHERNCWVYGNAQAYGSARVFGCARVYDRARVNGNAHVYDDVWVYGTAEVSGNARVAGDARVLENARVYGDAWVYGTAYVSGDAHVYGDAEVFESAYVTCDAQVFGDAQIYNETKIAQNAMISSTSDYILVGPIGSRGGLTTFYKNKDGGISVSCGCFVGTLDEFKERVKLVYADSEYTTNALYYKQYTDAIVYAEMTLLTDGRCLVWKRNM